MSSLCDILIPNWLVTAKFRCQRWNTISENSVIYNYCIVSFVNNNSIYSILIWNVISNKKLTIICRAFIWVIWIGISITVRILIISCDVYSVTINKLVVVRTTIAKTWTLIVTKFVERNSIFIIKRSISRHSHFIWLIIVNSVNSRVYNCTFSVRRPPSCIINRIIWNMTIISVVDPYSWVRCVMDNIVIYINVVPPPNGNTSTWKVIVLSWPIVHSLIICYGFVYSWNF